MNLPNIIRISNVISVIDCDFGQILFGEFSDSIKKIIWRLADFKNWNEINVLGELISYHYYVNTTFVVAF